MADNSSVVYKATGNTAEAIRALGRAPAAGVYSAMTRQQAPAPASRAKYQPQIVQQDAPKQPHREMDAAKDHYQATLDMQQQHNWVRQNYPWLNGGVDDKGFSTKPLEGADLDKQLAASGLNVQRRKAGTNAGVNGTKLTADESDAELRARAQRALGIQYTSTLGDHTASDAGAVQEAKGRYQATLPAEPGEAPESAKDYRDRSVGDLNHAKALEIAKGKDANSGWKNQRERDEFLAQNKIDVKELGANPGKTSPAGKAAPDLSGKHLDQAMKIANGLQNQYNTKLIQWMQAEKTQPGSGGPKPAPFDYEGTIGSQYEKIHGSKLGASAAAAAPNKLDPATAQSGPPAPAGTGPTPQQAPPIPAAPATQAAPAAPQTPATAPAPAMAPQATPAPAAPPAQPVQAPQGNMWNRGPGAAPQAAAPPPAPATHPVVARAPMNPASFNLGLNPNGPGPLVPSTGQVPPPAPAAPTTAQQLGSFGASLMPKGPMAPAAYPVPHIPLDLHNAILGSGGVETHTPGVYAHPSAPGVPLVPNDAGTHLVPHPDYTPPTGQGVVTGSPPQAMSSLFNNVNGTLVPK